MNTVKNYFAIAFACVYLTLTVGVAKTTHYCMGRDKGTSFFTFAAANCACFMPEGHTMPCCEDKHDLVVLEADQSVSQTISINPLVPVLIEVMEWPVLADTGEVSGSTDDIRLQPDRPPQIPLFKVYCSLKLDATLS